MRFVVLGAGAIGGALGGGLHRAGHDVLMLARGASADVLRSAGLTLQTPDADEVLHVPVGSVEDVRDGDVVILAVKSQDTAAALDSLAGRDVTIVCAQNGVANEAEALRRFDRVYGVFVWLPAQHLEPGVVQIYCAPVIGTLAVGRFPAGTDDLTAELARVFTDAGCDVHVSDDIMRLKRGKLLGNLINSIQVVVGDGDEAEELHELAMDEARACFAAAGLHWEDDTHRLGNMSPPREVHGAGHAFSSTWQSLQRGASLETDYLNGEIVLLGRLHGVPTPVNADVQRRVANLKPT
ncbi:ketopantoate reductase family protein [Solirubrobacter soli]|uniref:ketopantoate reductase family protein n=1 Tax=Solirubrobacter soli TaxID=363832 RepID=UPI000404B5E9|nr:2-dehydropantoate 2-reductase [Solirubrobacter soli]